MTDKDILQFELLKSEVQSKFLEFHTPADDDISLWKGIDIVYFQEDLLQRAKGNLSEKSFYTYFKTSPVSKLPRIDILNLLSIYAGFDSWAAFKKSTADLEEILKLENNTDIQIPEEESENIKENEEPQPKKETTSISNNLPNENLGESTPPEQLALHGETAKLQPKKLHQKVKSYLWVGMSIILACILAVLIFSDKIFSSTYEFQFVDADLGREVQNTVEIKILKEGESPINYRIQPKTNFVYLTKDKTLKMVVSSIFYHTDTIIRNLESAPELEIIELKPNEYNMMLYSYSTTKDFKQRQAQLNQLISDKAVIYQVFDNQYFSVETMTKQRYIAFLSLPTTSLENLDVIETKISNGKIVLIKFRIKRAENEN